MGHDGAAERLNGRVLSKFVRLRRTRPALRHARKEAPGGRAPSGGAPGREREGCPLACRSGAAGPSRSGARQVSSTSPMYRALRTPKAAPGPTLSARPCGGRPTSCAPASWLRLYLIRTLVRRQGPAWRNRCSRPETGSTRCTRTGASTRPRSARCTSASGSASWTGRTETAATELCDLRTSHLAAPRSDAARYMPLGP